MTRACPICRSLISNGLLTLSFPLPADYVLNSLQRIQACENCGMVFSDSGNTQEDYDRYYAQSSKYCGNSEAPRPFELKRYENTVARLNSLVRLDSRICDLGCGGGGLLRQLKKLKYRNLTGIDACDLPEQADFRFYRSELFRASSLTTEKFDLISCVGVFEHILELPAFISSLSSLISPQGLLYIEVPDAASYEERVISPFQDFNLEHINHFSRQTLETALLQNGFEILSRGKLYQPESNRYVMPVLSVTARLTGRFAASRCKDPDLRASILRYIQKSRSLLEEFDSAIEAQLGNHTELHLWGAGQLSLKLLELPSLRRRRIISIFDRGSTLKSLQGITISLPDQGRFSAPVLIGSILHAESIRNDILSRDPTALIIDLPYNPQP